jgi:hypothetical protein
MNFSKKRSRKFKKLTKQKRRHSQKRKNKLFRNNQKGGYLIKNIDNIIIGQLYKIKFIDDEGSDVIESEFAPIYDGEYIAIEKHVLSEGEEIEEDIPYVVFKHKLDERIIHIIKSDYVNTIDGKPLYFSTPINKSLSPILFTTEDTSDSLSNHYTYASCDIETTLQEELLNVSRVARLKKNGKTVRNNIPSDIEKNIQTFFLEDPKKKK